jgi:hypothetical protein
MKKSRSKGGFMLWFDCDLSLSPKGSCAGNPHPRVAVQRWGDL